MAAVLTRRWKIGAVAVTRIVELERWESEFATLLPDASPEYAQQFPWLVPDFATPAGRMLMSFQSFVVESRGRRVIIDTCIGNGRARTYPIACNLQTSFLEDLAAAGFAPDTIDVVVCTHMHFDHVGWNTRDVNGIWVPTFPHARYLFGTTEYDYWQRERHAAVRDTAHLADSIDPIVAADLHELVPSDHRITDELWLEPTPGHSPGHVCVRIRSEGKDAVITGDVMHHPIQIAVPGLEVNFDMDKQQAAKTRRGFVERYADRDVMIIGSHFCEPTSGWIVRDDAAFRLASRSE